MVTFYPFQWQILDDTAPFNKVAYYLDMGLGKTYIGAEKALQQGAGLTLIVCQKTKIDDWIEHFNEHYQINVINLTRPQEFKGFIEFIKYPDYNPAAFPLTCIINYDLIFRRPELLELKDFTLMLDESSLIQNETAKRTLFIMKLKPLNVILLSGTPTSGKYENLWSQMNLIGWEITNFVYNRQYVNWKKIDVEGVPIPVIDKDEPYKNVDRLKRKMREHGAVFLKTDDVFDLPEQNFIEVNVSKTKEYNRFRKNKLITIDTKNLCEFHDDSDFHGRDVTPRVELVGDTTLTFRLYSRMLCGHLNPGKLAAFRDLCESTNDRLIVFYNFDAELEALRDIAAKLEKPVSEVNGHTKDLTAYEAEENSITLIQYQAGAMGLNLQKANKIIYFTPTDKSELFEQSKKRIHRIGQEKPCFYYLLVCENSVEDQEIFPVLGLRKELTDDLFKD
jgi:SNF2 family DNA or RNA helicase